MESNLLIIALILFAKNTKAMIKTSGQIINPKKNVM